LKPYYEDCVVNWQGIVYFCLLIIYNTNFEKNVYVQIYANNIYGHVCDVARFYCTNASLHDLHPFTGSDFLTTV